MDDKRFDKFIKEKAETFEGPPYEAEALEKLHARLDMLGKAASWYVRYKAILFTCGVLSLFTLLNFLIIRHFNHQENRKLVTELENLKETVAALPSLKRDTVYIYRERQTNTDEALKEKSGGRPSNAGSLKEKGGGRLIYLGNTNDLSREMIQLLERSYMVVYNGRDIYLNPVEQSDYLQAKSFHFSGKNTGSGDTGASGNRKAIIYKQDDSDGQNLSLKTVRALNKHYGQGVGIKIGVEIEAAKHQYDIGDGTLHAAFGAVSEYILSPNWSIAAGVRYGIRTYDLEGAENFVNYPGFDAGAGKGVTVEVESAVLEIPVSLRYYYLVSTDKKIFMSMGYVPNLYLTQEFEYSQEAVVTSYGQPVNIINTTNIDQVKVYAGAIDATFGISWLLPNGKTAQAGLFYRKGLDQMGMEGRKVNMFGLKAAYLFPVR